MITRASDNIKNKLKQSEGLSLKPYQTTYKHNGKTYVDKPTIGYGNTQYENGVHVAMSDSDITLQRANQLFNNIFSTFEIIVRRGYTGYDLNQNQFDALCHYVYNTGSFDNEFKHFTTNNLKNSITNDELIIYWSNKKIFSKSGVLIEALVPRRKYEVNLFISNKQNNAASVTVSTPNTQPFNSTTQDIPKPQDAYIINTLSQSLQEFINNYNILLTPEEVLNYKTNSASILKSYNTSESAQYNKIANINLIGNGAKVAIPLNKIKSKSIYTINQTLISNTDYNAFIESEIKRLINNPKYAKINLNNSNESIGSVFKRQDALSVWLWCKSIDDGSGRLVDISDYVENISTTSAKDGGNFTISLPHITYERVDGIFQIPVQNYIDSNKDNFISKNSTHKSVPTNTFQLKADRSLVDKSSQAGDSVWKRNADYFQNLIQNNDLIFIKFEKIGSDASRDLDNSKDDFIDSKELYDGIFDMIGLCDICSEYGVAENSNIGISLTGRDLSKLLIDDGTYFFPVEFAAKNSEQIIKNSSSSKSAARLMISPSKVNDKGYENYNYAADGGIIPDLQFNFDNTQTIEEWLTFIFSQLTNIDICVDTLFNAYPDKSFIISKDDTELQNGNIVYKRIKANGIWQGVKLIIDKTIANRRVADTSLAFDTGSLLNIIRKVAQEPWVEILMDTFGNKYYFSFRKPPFSYESIISNKCIDIFEDDVLAHSIEFSNEIYTWYKLNPFNSIFGNDDNAGFLTLFPAVMFPEYMEIWGSKILEVTSNYLDFDASVSDLSDVNLENIKKQALEDLDWLIETNCYLPFTRTGTITIKPDRRIKKGMSIRNYGTGEIFYVDSIVQTRSYMDVVDGVTVLKVSRGMVEEHLDKYFKIINLRKNGDLPSNSQASFKTAPIRRSGCFFINS